METKKSNRANLERKRSLFFQIGLLLALGLALVAFEWRSAPSLSEIKIAPPVETGFVEVDIDRTYPNEPPPPPPPQPSLELEIVDNDVFVGDDPIFIDVGLTENLFSDLGFGSVQIEEEPEPEFFDKVEDMPLFNGKTAEEGFREFIRNNLVYPPLAIENQISGRVHIQFMVDQNGNIVDAEVTRSVDRLLDAEALRLIRSTSGMWTPGRQQNKAVKVRFTFPIIFRLQ